MKKIICLFCALMLFALDVSNIQPSNNSEEELLEVKENKAVFGEHLFSGNFKQVSKNIYNPDYKVNIADVIDIKIWGAVELSLKAEVDSKGNIFIPQVGVINVLGVNNKDLVKIIQDKVKQIYKDNVFVYANMQTYQEVLVFVSGNVKKPGLYAGLSSDSVIQFIDKAGGINLNYGSFRDINILRNNEIIKELDLYDFLLNGRIENITFRNSDVIFVNSIKSYVSVSGEVYKPYRFELGNDIVSLADIARVANVKPTATTALVKSYDENNKISINTYKKSEFKDVILKSADEIEFNPDFNADKINITINGEHKSLHNMVVSKGTSLQDVLDKLEFTDMSELSSVQLFRKSVSSLQKNLLLASLKELETLALTSTSQTPQEAGIKATWTQNVLAFIDRAKKVQPKGQIVIEDKSLYKDIILEEADVINIPSKNNLVVVSGEVQVPGAFVFLDKYKVKDYIKIAGDFSQRADKNRILIIHLNGKAEQFKGSGFLTNKVKLAKGDSILVLPKIDSYNLQVVSLLSQILYQIAVTTKVVLDI